MSLNNPPAETCPSETPLPPRKRPSSYPSIVSFSSAKRRRISLFGGDLNFQPESGSSSTLHPINSVDRYVPSRPKNHLPLNVTPRTKRISGLFGLTDPRVFSFNENQENMPSTRDESKTFGLLRRSVSSLFHSPPRRRLTSVTENLSKRQQCILTLDGPGINPDPYAYPISWSRRNLIAVACGNDVFYQNLNNRVVTRLCTVDVSMPGELRSIEWAGEGRENILASGSSTGVVQVWDAGQPGEEGTYLRMWRENQSAGVGGLDWNQDLLSVGLSDGTVSLFDTRSKAETKRVQAHQGKVLGIRWSTDSLYMATGDDLGMVYIWDKRAGKHLLDESIQSSKMRHRGPVKALAWCPWKPDLLATGSVYPEGKIRIWTSSSPSTPPTPIETLPLNTSVLSLHWSPHCKELLSTHGSSFAPLPASLRTSQISISAVSPHLPRPRLKPIPSPLSNSITVHEYPSGKRLLMLTAHFGPVTHSCLGPDGQNVFTVCPKEETIKMWHVWKKRTEEGKRESVFDKCMIR